MTLKTPSKASILPPLVIPLLDPSLKRQPDAVFRRTEGGVPAIALRRIQIRLLSRPRGERGPVSSPSTRLVAPHTKVLQPPEHVGSSDTPSRPGEQGKKPLRTQMSMPRLRQSSCSTGSSCSSVTEETSENPNKDADVEEIIGQHAKLLFCCNMTIEPGDIREIISKHVSSDTYRFKFIIDKAEKWRINWQGAMWGSKWFLEFVRKNVADHDSSGIGRLVKYADKTLRQRSEFWLHETRWTRETAMEIMAPLKKALDREGVLGSDEWSVYIQTVYDIACQKTYEHRIRQGPNGEPPDNDILQIYTDIRAVPEKLFPRRPPVSAVPANTGGP